MDNQAILLTAERRSTGAEERILARYLRRWSSLIRPIKSTLDVSTLALAFVAAYLLRFDFVLPDANTRFTIALELPVVVLVQFWTLSLGGGLRFVWRYFSLTEAKALAALASGSLILLVLARSIVGLSIGYWFSPVSLLVVDTLLAFGGLTGLRAACRILNERYGRKPKAGLARSRKRILLIGAGRVGMMVARELYSSTSTEYEVVGFIDDDPLKHEAIIQGFKVFGSMEAMPKLVRELNIDHVVITIAAASQQDIFRILRICESVPIRAQIIPTVDEILLGRVEIARIRDVQVEDLLPRKPVHFNEEGVMKFLHSRRVMITGAGGSIGSELVRQVAHYKPAELILVERTEFALFNIDREMRGSQPEVRYISLLADVGDCERMASIFHAHHPEVVIHAAAHKHVPMMERNPTEAVKNNILATYSLGKMAGEFGVEAFVLISTDKAVRPASVMGASKRMAELIVQDLNRHYLTRFVSVRFGNVLGSTGSVIPIFLEQIRNGGPVTVTHPDMTRYFMTIPEAAHLVLEACTMGKGGEVFILDMGEPVRIVELAERLISLAGLKRKTDIEIVFTGVRPGEKLTEETAHSEEHLTKTVHPKIFIGEIANYPEELILDALEQLELLAKSGDEGGLRLLLNNVVPESNLHVGGEALEAEKRRDSGAELPPSKPPVAVFWQAPAALGGHALVEREKVSLRSR